MPIVGTGSDTGTMPSLPKFTTRSSKRCQPLECPKCEHIHEAVAETGAFGRL